MKTLWNEAAWIFHYVSLSLPLSLSLSLSLSHETNHRWNVESTSIRKGVSKQRRESSPTCARLSNVRLAERKPPLCLSHPLRSGAVAAVINFQLVIATNEATKSPFTKTHGGEEEKTIHPVIESRGDSTSLIFGPDRRAASFFSLVDNCRPARCQAGYVARRLSQSLSEGHARAGNRYISLRRDRWRRTIGIVDVVLVISAR